MTRKSASSSAAAPSRRRVASYAEPLVANVQNAAAMCDLSPRTIKQLVADKTLKSVLAGGRRLIYVASIHELLGIGVAHEPVPVIAGSKTLSRGAARDLAPVIAEIKTKARSRPAAASPLRFGGKS